MVLKNGNRQGAEGAKEETLRLGSIFVSIQKINRPFAPAHSTWGTQRDVICALQTVAGHKAQPRFASAGLASRVCERLPRGNGPPRGMSRTSSDRRERAVQISSPRAAEGRPCV